MYVYKPRVVREQYVSNSYAHYYHPCACSGFLLGVAGVVLFAVALGTHFLYKSNNENVALGMFEVCTTSNNHCSSQISSSCSYTGFLNINFSVPDCSLFNAMRALCAIATIFAGLAVVLMFFTCCSGFVFYEFASGLCLLSAACGCASYFIALAYFQKNLNNNGMGYGYSFWILLAGWIVELFASCTHAGWGSAVYV